MDLSQIQMGSRLLGVVPGAVVEVVAPPTWHQQESVTIIYREEQGGLGSKMFYANQADELELASQELSWSFVADSDEMKLASEAMRIHLAHLFDPYLAVYTSSIQPLPHQISAVYEKMLPRLPLRYVLADDPGAGKTVMTGLLLSGGTALF